MIKSESISKLVSALALAKAAFKPVLKLSENPGFKRNGKASKYADLATAIEATEAALLANGLVVSQFPVNDGERVGTLTLVTHESGEYMGEAFTLPLGQQNAQTGVAAVTYARRTGYLAALGIASEDDDGQMASGRSDETGYADYPAAMPDFQEARHEAPRPQPSPRVVETTETLLSETELAYEAPAAVAGATQGETITPENVPGKGDAYEGADNRQPNEEELTKYRAAFHTLGTNLTTQGKLKPSKSLPVNRKLVVFTLRTTGAEDMTKITKAQWDNFFNRVENAKAKPEVGFVGLAKLVNQANGIEEKK